MKQLANQTRQERLQYENRRRGRGGGLVIGVDEAGRGPLAGPVTAGAFALLDTGLRDPWFDYLLAEVADSKKVGARKRERIYAALMSCPGLAWGFARVEPRVIDRINILRASKKAMAAAVSNLVARLPHPRRQGIFCLVDGNFPIDVPFGQESIIKGDQKVFSISAASIIAKVGRDRIMAAYHKKYPVYGFADNFGYPTASHCRALRQFGPCRIHRRSFGPVKEILPPARLRG